jgi:thioredoxin
MATPDPLILPKTTQFMPRQINKKNFRTAVLRHDKPVVVDVWADWCGPCHALAPQFAAAADALEGKARFVKLDADKNQKIVKQYKVRSLPTILYFKDGELVDRSSGVTSKSAILRRVKPLLSEEDQAEVQAGSWWKFWA